MAVQLRQMLCEISSMANQKPICATTKIKTEISDLVGLQAFRVQLTQN